MSNSNLPPSEMTATSSENAVDNLLKKLEKSRTGTDWKAEFRPEELAMREDLGQTVRLRGLQRCAHLAGLVESYPTLQHIDRPGGHAIIQCIYHVKFNDGTHFAGAADVNEGNIDKKFSKFPTAVAESRAEARALRKALNITDMYSFEEVDGQEGGSTGEPDTGGKIETQQIAAINSMIDQLKVPLSVVLVEVLPNARAKSVFSLEELTSLEAVNILRNLNEKRAELDKQPVMGKKKGS